MIFRRAWCMTLSCVLASACTPALFPLTRPASLSAGEWSGTTSQGAPITFVVSTDERVTSITVGYDFNGCSGSHAFLDLDVPTAPDLTCIPGPCSGALSSYRAFGYSAGSVTGGSMTQVNGLFLPRNEAKGQATFRNYAGCGDLVTAEWSATRR
jgi:hypothetical protein